MPWGPRVGALGSHIVPKDISDFSLEIYADDSS